MPVGGLCEVDVEEGKEWYTVVSVFVESELWRMLAGKGDVVVPVEDVRSIASSWTWRLCVKSQSRSETENRMTM